jgi:hypothetical protein
VSRQWRNEPYQKITFRGRALINHASICIDVHGASNTHRRHIVFFPCHNGLNQQWYIDQQGIKFPRYPLTDGVKFQIKSIMKTNRALFYHEHIGGHQYRLRIRNNFPEDIKQWWIFDWRTRSIRSAANRRNAISIQRGGNNWMHNGYIACTRKFDGKSLQKIRWFNGSRRNIRDIG